MEFASFDFLKQQDLNNGPINIIDHHRSVIAGGRTPNWQIGICP